MKNTVGKKEKIDKILKIACLILIGIIVIEGIFFLCLKIKRTSKIVYKTTVSSVVGVDKGYVVVGSSDFKHSKTNKYSEYTKAFLAKYNLGNKVIFETMYDKGLYSQFNDVIKIKDGYLAVGEIQMSETHVKEGSSEGLIVKYDEDGKELWHKNFVILGVNKFLKVIEDSDKNYVVVGSSLYESNLIGNHKTGGAIIVKYDKDGKKIAHSNNDGPKTGVYNDIMLVSDGYIVVGQIKGNSGIVAKYDKNLQLKWRKLVGTTDSYGLRMVAKYDFNSFLVIGSKLAATNKEEQSGIIIKFDNSGNKLKEENFKFDKVNRLEGLMVDDKKIFVTGMTSNANKDENVNSFVLTLNENLEKKEEKTKKEDKSIIFSGLVKINNKTYIYGYSNSKVKEIKSNGKDIVSFLLELDNFKYLNLFN